VQWFVDAASSPGPSWACWRELTNGIVRVGYLLEPWSLADDRLCSGLLHFAFRVDRAFCLRTEEGVMIVCGVCGRYHNTTGCPTHCAKCGKGPLYQYFVTYAEGRSILTCADCRDFKHGGAVTMPKPYES
jgi:hypothetical protein